MQKRQWRRGSWFLAIGVMGCGGAPAEPGAVTRSGSLEAPPGPDAGGLLPPGGAALSASGSCTALLAALHADLFERTRRRADLARESPYYFTPDANTGSAFEDPVPAGVSSDTQPPPPSPVAGSAGGEAASAARSNAPDVLAVDGDRLYLLDNESETQRLLIIESAAAEAPRVLASIAVEGSAIELTSRAGRVLVFSRVASALLGFGESFPDYEPSFTKLTVVDVHANPPRVVRELYVEGEYAFARQYGGLARVVIEHFPKLRLDAPVLSDTDILGRTRPQSQIDAQVDAWVAITDQSVLSSGLDAYLPSAFERRPDGVLVPHTLHCDSAFAPEPGRANPGATSVFSLDLGAAELESGSPDVDGGAASPGGPGELPLSSVTVFGYAQGVALDSGAAIIRQNRLIQTPDAPPRTESDLHVFELAGLDAHYAASGTVSGGVTSLERRAGVLRTLASEAIYQGDRFQGQQHRALALAIEGGQLTELGSTLIAAANDGITAARFVEDHAYLLTTNVEGPGFGPATTALVRLDFSDPRSPRETGRLALATSSSTLIPLPGERLLSVASAADADELSEHAELLLFDVGNASPSVVARYAYGAGTSADGDPRALAFSADLTRFGLPVALGGSFGNGFDVFELSANGISRLGRSVPESPELTLVQCLELRGLPTDPDSVAGLEQDPAAVASLVAECNAFRPRPFVRRGVLREGEAIVSSRAAFPVVRSTVAVYALDALGSPPLGQIDF